MKSKKRLAALIGFVVGIALFVVPIASAHHPEITVSLGCDGTVSYTVNAWQSANPAARTFTGVKVYSGSMLVGTGNFNAGDNFTFSGSFTVDTSVTSVTLTAETDGTWGDNYTGVDSRSATADRPTNCVTVTTSLSSTTVTAGGSVHDSATLHGQTSNAGGTVTYSAYTDSNCTQLVSGSSSTKTVISGSVADSDPVAFTTAGDYYWQASYSGDSNTNNPATSICTDEHLVVDKTAPSVATSLSSSTITVGGTVHDSATLSGTTPSAGGSVTYSVYSNNGCSGTALDGGTKTVTNGVVPDSSPVAFGSAGDYYWQAVYSGDPNNASAASACTSEHLVVSSPPASPQTPPSTQTPPTPQSPSISIMKNPKSQTIPSRSSASFSITVTNTGNVTLTNVSVSDPLSPDCSKTSSTIAALGSMAPGASVTYNCSLASVKSSFTNVATASGTPPSGPNVTASDSAPVTVTVTRVIVPPPPSHPAIAIVKDPKSQSTILGGTATFKITVTNTGDVTLTSVAVDDPLSPQCDRDLGTLVAGQSKTYSCTRTNLKRDFRNVATVTGTPPSGAKVTAGDHADVTMSFTPPKPKHPRIAIVKSPKSQTVTTKVKNGRSTTGATTTTIEYGSARFTIRVKNNGQVTLHGVVVTDPQSTGCERQLGTLPPGASRSYRCARNVVSSGFTNVASVTGTSPKGQKVHDSDHALVKVAVRTATSGGSSAGAKKRSSAPFAPPKAPATSPFTPPKTSASGAPSFTG